MKKKLLILVSAMLLLFGSVLTVSAEEKMATSTAVVRSLETLELYYEDLALWRDGDTILKGGNRDEYNFFAKLNSSFYGCYIKNDEKSTEENFFYELYAYDYDESVFVEPVLPDMTGCNRYKQYRIYEDGTEKLIQDTTAGGITYVSLRVKDVDSKGWRHFSQMNSLRSNIPFFNSVESAKKYFANGDTSGIINDWYDNMISDESFGLTGFDADSTITATWTGTTHDNVISTYNKAKVGIRPAYSLKSYPGQIASVKSVLQEYDIADKTFTKLYSELAPSDTDLFLRYLEVIPNYQKEPMGEMYVGKSCFIWFKADGSIDKVENRYDDGKPKLNTDFYLLNVACKDTLGDVAGDNISWIGTTHDSIISTLSLEDTLIEVYCCFIDASGKKEFIDYHEVNEKFYGGGNPLRIRNKIDDVNHGFQFYSNSAEKYAQLWSKSFTGYVYLVPTYNYKNSTVKGLTTVVDVYSNDVRYVEDFDPENPDTPTEPIDPDNPTPTTPLPDAPKIDDDFDIADIFTYFFQLLNWLKGNIGQVPNLLAVLFPMLPAEFSYLITVGFVVVIFLRIIGR